MTERYKEEALLFKAFADNNRLQIIELLAQGEYCACDLLERLSIGQSTLSHHMKILTDCGVVSSRRASKWTYYSLNDNGSRNARNYLDRILSKKEISRIQCECD